MAAGWTLGQIRGSRRGPWVPDPPLTSASGGNFPLVCSHALGAFGEGWGQQGTARPCCWQPRPNHPGHSLSCCALFKETIVMCSGDTSQRVPVATVGQARPGVRENRGGGARIPLLSDLTSSVSGTAGTAGDTVLQNHEASTRLREAASAAGFKGGRLARV